MLELLAEAERLGAELPVSVAREIAESMIRTEHDPRVCLQSLSPADRRERLMNLFRRWQGMPQACLGAALVTAAIAAEGRRRKESLELVWTGPDSKVIPVRQTEQVLLELIRGARKSLLVVSYAVYRIPTVRDALCEAVGRAVRVRLILDLMDPAEIDGYNPLSAIGEGLLASVEVLYWPKDQRQPDIEGRRGRLHVKCVVADGARMFVSSANLTEQALRLNMELGVLITGTRRPGEVEEHFAELAQCGVLRPLVLDREPKRPREE